MRAAAQLLNGWGVAANQPDVCMVSVQPTVSLQALSDR